MNLFSDFLVSDSKQNHRVKPLSHDSKPKNGRSKLKSMSTVRRTRNSNPLNRWNRKTIDFTNVGGLAHHLSVLREVIMFPLMFTNLYSHFNIKPPRGVLFHGPPGTGKTFVAGALVAELNRLGMGRVNFFHRKGADILDKWVGESERKLRELFERAAKSKPAIIFFDELDGLAPQRCKNNDQIHCSVVTTLLALMDGLDSMPGVIVIGATNRIEAVDPALRRPGRFDKELYFPLPSTQGRKEIFQVHTRFWADNQLSNSLITKLAETTMGFSGSDIQALCTEAVMCCLKRCYPAVSASQDLRRIRINFESLKVEECDFMEACTNFIPWSEKSNTKNRNLTGFIKPLLQRQLNNILRQLLLLWPHFLKPSFKYTAGQHRYAGRLLLIGSNLQGLNNHLLPALLHALEHLPAYLIETPGLVQSMMRSARQNLPAIVVLSRIDAWWDLMENGVQTYLMSALEDLHASLPLLLVATCSKKAPSVDYFFNNSSIVFKVEDPDVHEREVFFSPLFFGQNGITIHNILLQKETTNGEEMKTQTKTEQSVHQIPQSLLSRGDSIRIGRLRGVKRKHDKNVFTPSKKHKATKTPRTSTAPARSGTHVTTVLTDMLYSIHTPPKIEENDSLKTIYYNNMLGKDSDCCDGSEDEANINNYFESTDLGKISVYKLWRRASNDVSDGMPVGHLELLYDTMAACINIHKDNFKKLLENLETVLIHFERRH